MVLTMMLSSLLGYKGAARLAGVAVCIVVLVPYTYTDAAHMALSRFLEVAFGICVALAVTAIFYPKETWNALQKPPK